MNKQDIGKFIKTVQLSVSKHSPEILTGIGIAGMVTTTVLAVKETPKALHILEDAEHTKGESLTATEKIKVCWKCYIPSVVTGAASIVCLIGASSVNARRNAALATAYKLSETALTEYRDKVVETIGEKKEQVIREKIAEDRLEKNPVEENKIVITDKGNTLCLEPISGQYFRSDIDKIKRAVIDLNEKMQRDPFGYISLNEFYDELNMEHSSRGDELGWCISKGIIRIDFHAKLAKNDEPCIVIDYVNPPVYDYSKFI